MIPRFYDSMIPWKFVILTYLSELRGQFLSKTVKHGYIFAKMLTVQLKIVISVMSLTVSQGGCAQAILAPYIRVPPLSYPENRTEPHPAQLFTKLILKPVMYYQVFATSVAYTVICRNARTCKIFLQRKSSLFAKSYTQMLQDYSFVYAEKQKHREINALH